MTPLHGCCPSDGMGSAPRTVPLAHAASTISSRVLLGLSIDGGMGSIFGFDNRIKPPATAGQAQR